MRRDTTKRGKGIQIPCLEPLDQDDELEALRELDRIVGERMPVLTDEEEEHLAVFDRLFR